VDLYRVAELEAAKGRQLDAARPDAVARVHGTDKLTARERIALLLDAQTEVEYGSIAAQDADGNWIPEAGGVDYVGSIDDQTVITSSTDYTDKGGGYGAGRLERLFALALDHLWPVVFFVDGGGSRARHPRTGFDHTEINGQLSRFTLFDGVAELSGLVPTVAIVSGPSFAGHASLAGFSDFVIATPGSSIGMGGPPMVEAALGMTLTPNELAGVEMHELTGGIDLLVDDEPQAIEAARRYLSYQRPLTAGTASPTAGDLVSLVPESGSYDMYQVIEAIVDQDSFFELRPQFARSMITGFARVEGLTIGVLANQPAHCDGAIDENAATKAGRFIEQCDAYQFPVLSLIDTPGAVTTWTTDGDTVTEPGISRWHTRPIVAHQHRTVPLFAVQTRISHGIATHIMAGPPTAPTPSVFTLAWPTTEIGHIDGYSATRNVNAFDDVINPGQTRQHLARMLGLLPTPKQSPVKKHPIDTW
jgi:acetyl-CoA carboxylase carboxyltransferase component